MRKPEAIYIYSNKMSELESDRKTSEVRHLTSVKVIQKHGLTKPSQQGKKKFLRHSKKLSMAEVMPAVVGGVVMPRVSSTIDLEGKLGDEVTHTYRVHQIFKSQRPMINHGISTVDEYSNTEGTPMNKKIATKSIMKSGSQDTGSNMLHQIQEVADVDFEAGEFTTKNRAPEKQSTSGSLVFGFGDDEKNKAKLEAMGEKYYYQQHEVTYSLRTFIEFFIYHFLWYGLLGYLLTIAVLPFRHLRILFKNMKFYQFEFGIMFFQLWMWLNSVLLWYPVLFLDTSITNMTAILVNFVSVIMRSTNVAAKYATFHPTLLQKYKEIVIPGKDINDDSIFGGWMRQEIKTIEIETNNAMKRSNFDEGIFYMSFLDKVNGKIEEDASQNEQELQLEYKSSNEAKYCHGDIRPYYSGQMIFYLMVQRFNKTSNKITNLIFILIMSLIWTFSPIVAKAIEGLPFYSKNMVDNIAFYFNLLTVGKLAYFTTYFFIMARYDIKRTIFLMSQLSHMISPQKLANEGYKMLPTINFLEESTLNSWKILRRVTMDYGKCYFYRHGLFLPATFTLAFTMFFGCFGVQALKQRAPHMFPSKFNLEEMQIVLGLMSLVFFAMTFGLLLEFSVVNDFYEIHILKLAQIRQIISDLSKYEYFYFDQHYRDREIALKGKPGAYRSAIYVRPISSLVHTKIAQDIAKTLGPLVDTYIRTYLEKSLCSIDSITKELTVDQKYQSIEIIGLRITRHLIAQLFIIIVSVTVGFYQLFIM